MKNLLAIFIVLIMGIPLAYAEGTISRGDGFLLLWGSINRAVYDTREKPFSDVVEGDRGEREITYAKNRGLLDGDSDSRSPGDGAFHPDDPLTMEDALLWLYRTRNVEELDAMQREHLPEMMERYSITSTSDLTVSASEEQLLEMMRLLDQKLRDEVHEVSLYGEQFHGDGTAFGEKFDMYALTAAHRSFPHNTLVKVTNVENEKTVTVRINDRGPYVEGRDMDLSVAAFTTIAERSKGVINARFERLGDATLVSGCSLAPDAEITEAPRLQQRLTRDVRFQRGIPHRQAVGSALVLKANKWFVVRGVLYPDGRFVRMQDWVSPEEHFSFTPSSGGDYVFTFTTAKGVKREMRMEVIECIKKNA
ncbi:MAG: septal ring lytic transglycosylase RlpA family protein [Patescibacteria group bacterium]